MNEFVTFNSMFLYGYVQLIVWQNMYISSTQGQLDINLAEYFFCIEHKPSFDHIKCIHNLICIAS